MICTFDAAYNLLLEAVNLATVDYTLCESIYVNQ